jgi:hypothetical protein
MLLLLIFIGNLLGAQVLGHGHASTNTNCVLTAGMYFYTDDNRARVISTPTFSGINATLSLDHVHGTFNPGEEVLLIQMKGANIGMHQNATVNSFNTSTNTLNLTSVDLTGFYTSYSTFSMTSTDRLQVIRIWNFNDLTMKTGSYILCQPWNDNDGTGGIVCFVVDGVFKIDGGQVYAGGYGYGAKEDVNVTFRGSNSGELPNPINDHLAINGPTALTCAINAYGFDALNNLIGATRGGTATNQTTKGSANIGTGINYGQPTFHSNFINGTPGYYTATYGSGSLNAGGGGFGGDGASNSVCSTTGGTGLIGTSGWSGGAAGIGGNGGGGIYIKAYEIDINTSDVIFIANGADGFYGEDGGSGGAGGIGGIGGAGCTAGSCSNIWQGANGGCGDWGIGGDGGDGGDGGNPGTIWISTVTVGGLGFDNSNFDVHGGKGGLGGYKGWGGGNGTPDFIYAQNLCDGTFCKKPDYHNCDPDPIMCFLKICDHFSRITATNILHFDKTGGSLTNFVEFDIASGNLYLVDATGVLQQVQVTDAGIAYNVFYDFGTEMSNKGFTNTSKNTPCSITPLNLADVTWVSNRASYYTSTYNHDGNTKYFQNALPIPSKSVYFETCPQYGGGGYQNPPLYYERPRARRGTDAGDGTTSIKDKNNSSPNPHSNVYVETQSSFSQSMGVSNTTKSITKLSVFPIPTSGDIWLNLNSASIQTADVLVIDITGKQVFKQNIKLQKGDNKQLLKLEGIAKGIYTLQLQTADGKLTQQIMVN